MKGLDDRLRELVAAVRSAYQPTQDHDALVRATIAELTGLEEPPARRASSSGGRPTRRSVFVAPPEPDPIPKPTVSPATEHALVAILDAPAEDGETIAMAFHRRESELRALFATLRLPEARALHARLANPVDGDGVAQTFGRLVRERRERLLVFLADARRREAVHPDASLRGAL